MSIFRSSPRIWVVDSTVTEKPNVRGKNTRSYIPTFSFLTYVRAVEFQVPSWLGPSQPFKSHPQSFSSQSHGTTLLSTLPCFVGCFLHALPRGTSRGKTSITAEFPEDQPAAAYLNKEKCSHWTGTGKKKNLPLWEGRRPGNETQSSGIRTSCYLSLGLYIQKLPFLQLGTLCH